MPLNHQADINQWAWYEHKGRKFVCTYAGWSRSAADKEILEPVEIHLLEFMTCTPKPIEPAHMIRLLASGAMRVIKNPFSES